MPLFYFIKYYRFVKRKKWCILQDLNNVLRHMQVDDFCVLNT